MRLRRLAYARTVLLDGVNHVAVLTHDTDRLSRFYTDTFDAPPARTIEQQPGFKLSLIDIGDGRELNVFEIEGNDEANRQTPMFGRGRLDHVGLQAASLQSFEEIRRRLMACGAADDFVSDFGPVLSVFFVDPDGLEGEVVVANPDAEPGVTHPPGTRAARFTAPA
jgi:catechol 2,3-dioxygenase-like lactoylglutathione lyase family enzyme